MRRTIRAFKFGTADGDTIVVGLAGFLVRGGILLLLLPSAVLPSVIGFAGLTGVDAFGIDGHPTPWLYEIVAIIGAAAALWLLVSFLLGSLIDSWLIDAARDESAHLTSRSQPLPRLEILLDMAGVRAVCILPVVGSLVWAGSRIYSSAYNELTTPTNLATPLAVRVVQGAMDAVLVVGLIWLASEVVGAIAVRRVVLTDRGVWHAIPDAVMQLLRRPISSVATVIVSYGASLVAAGLAIAVTATAFDWCRVAARNQRAIAFTIGPVGPGDLRPVVLILAAVVLGLAWIAALAVSGLASAWRSAAFTGETAAAVSEARKGTGENGLGLSGPTSGD